MRVRSARRIECDRDAHEHRNESDRHAARTSPRAQPRAQPRAWPSIEKDYRYHSLMLPCAPPRMLMLTQLLLALLLCVAACAPKFERPNITVVGIEMQHANLLQQNFQVK